MHGRGRVARGRRILDLYLYLHVSHSQLIKQKICELAFEEDASGLDWEALQAHAFLTSVASRSWRLSLIACSMSCSSWSCAPFTRSPSRVSRRAGSGTRWALAFPL